MVLTPCPDKYLPPVLPRLVVRRTLLERLSAGSRRRVVLIVGQPAQGKSTLVAAYLKTAGIPTAWNHLDRESADAEGFFTLLVHALDRAGADLGNRSDFVALLEAQGPHRSMPWSQVLSHLLARVPRPAAIVLDGIDRLGPHAKAHVVIARLMEALPKGVQLFLISRQLPPLKLQRLRIRRQLVILENADLAFNLEEIRLFFSLQSQLRLTDDQIRRIRRHTEGWVGGLVLIGEALGRVPPDQRAAFLDDNLLDILKSETLAYFSEEIFAFQPRAVRTFLTCSALLDPIEPEIAARLAGVRDARAVLDDLAGRNVFTRALTEGDRCVGYQYHPLFRNFLQVQFERTVSPVRRAQLLKQVGEIYAERGQHHAAVDCFLKAGAFSAAADLIRQVAVDLTIGERHEELGRWIASVPDDRRRKDPWLLLWEAVAQRRPGETLAVEDLERAYNHFQSQDDPRGRCLTLAYLIEAGVFQVVGAHRLAPWLAEGKALLKHLGLYPYYNYAKALLWLQLGLAHTFSTGELNKGISACRNAAVLARQIGDARLEFKATLIPVSALAVKGEFQAADQALACCDAHLKMNTYPEYQVLNQLVQTQLALYRGDLARAGRYLEETRLDLEHLGLLFLYPLFVESKGLLRAYQGNLAEAGTTARHLMDVAVMTGNRRIEAQALRLRAQVHYFRGACDAAARDIEQAVAHLTGLSDGDFCLFHSLLLQGIVAYHRQDADLSQQALAAAHEGFVQMGAPIAMAESHMAQAFLAESRAVHDEARRHLSEGLGIAVDRKYRHLIVLRPADLAAACRLAIHLGLQNRGESTQRLLALLEPASPGIDAPGHRTTKTSVVMISAEAHRSRLPHLLIRSFGSFVVQREGGAPISDLEWHGHQPKMLLKAIVAHGARDVPKDVLIEDLWPDAISDAALRRFKVTLHRLRRTLEPTMHQTFGWAYLHLKDNLVSLDGELCRIDVDEFNELCRRLRRIEPMSDDDEALALCQEIRRLYRGDFLVEEPYAPWVEAKRSLLRDDYLGALERLADIYEHRRGTDALIGTLKDMARTAPARDDIQRRLMQSYVGKGDHALALSVYQEFQSFLAADLDVTPDPATIALYQRIRRESQPRRST